jgi:hypothetical protein
MAEGILCTPASPAWTAALRRLPHDVYQDPAYVRFDAAYGGGTPVAYLYEAGGHTLLLPLVLRPVPGTDLLDATSPYGYPAPVSDTTSEAFWAAAVAGLPVALRAARVVSCFVRMHPLLPAPRDVLAAAGHVEYHGDTVSIDLTLTEEQGWQQVRGNHRRHINRARRDGRTVAFDDWSHLAAFTSIYSETMHRVGAAPYYHFGPGYFRDLRAALGSRLHLAVALDGDEPIAGALCFAAGGIVQYHLGGTRTERLGEQPSKLVLWEVASWGRAHGYRAFNLGSGVGGRDNPLFHFKAGFSSSRHPFHTWRIVADPVSYEELSVRAGNPAGAADLSGYFPAYRAMPTANAALIAG